MDKGDTRFSKEASRLPTIISVINIFFIVLTLGAFIAMAMILSEYNTNLKKTDNNKDSEQCDSIVDIAIIGAGAAGTYASWKLSEKYPDRVIHLFDTNSRIGGRLYSVRIPGIGDFKADLGAMRLVSGWHRLTFDAIDELGLTVVNFTTPKSSEILYYLRGEHLLQEHIDQGLVPYKLTEEERNITGRPDIMRAMWNQHFIVPGEDDRVARKTIDGKYVRNLGNQLNLNQKLIQLDSSTLNTTLMFQHTETEKLTTVCAKDVILATGQKALSKIDWPERISNLQLDKDLNSLIDIPAVKVFLAYDSPWWRTEGNGWIFDKIKHNGEGLKLIVTDLPMRMVLDIGEDQTTGKSLLLIYNDMHNNLNFWRYHMEEGEIDPTAIPGEFTPTVELVHLTQVYLAKLFNISTEDIPKPYASTAQAWYTAPYYNAWHQWKLGYNYSAVQDSVLKPLRDRKIYVIGEAYADYLKQGFIEGAYDRAEAMLKRYYNA